MANRNSILELRVRAGMNRREFCRYFGIPYRTVQDWELGRRKTAAYLIDLVEFRMRTENLIH